MAEDPEINRYLQPGEQHVMTGIFLSSEKGCAAIITFYDERAYPIDADETWFVSQVLRVGDSFICYRKDGNLFARKIPSIHAKSQEVVDVQQ